MDLRFETNAIVNGQILLHPHAVALRPVRALKNGFRYYTAITFRSEPWAKVHMWLRRLYYTGQLAPSEEQEPNPIVIDILDAEANVLQDFTVTRKGFRWLYQQLGLRVEYEDID